MSEFGSNQSQTTLETDWDEPSENSWEEDDDYGEEQWFKEAEPENSFGDEQSCVEIDPKPPDQPYITTCQTEPWLELNDELDNCVPHYFEFAGSTRNPE